MDKKAERKSFLTTRMLVEGAMMIAIATVLSFIKFKSPLWINGGSVTAASMLPLIVFAYRWGGVSGIFVGAVYGLLQFAIEPYAAHPLSVFLDYPLAFGLLGLAGFFMKNKSGLISIVIGITVGMAGRFIAHFLSGFIFFAEYAPEDMNAVWYSFVYNGSYMLPELFLTIIAFILVRKTIDALK